MDWTGILVGLGVVIYVAVLWCGHMLAVARLKNFGMSDEEIAELYSKQREWGDF